MTLPSRNAHLTSIHEPHLRPVVGASIRSAPPPWGWFRVHRPAEASDAALAPHDQVLDCRRHPHPMRISDLLGAPSLPEGNDQGALPREPFDAGAVLLNGGADGGVDLRGCGPAPRRDNQARSIRALGRRPERGAEPERAARRGSLARGLGAGTRRVLSPQPGAGSASAAWWTSARRCSRKARSAAFAVSSIARRYD